MKKLSVFFLLFILIFAVSGAAFTIKNPENKFEAGFGYTPLRSAVELQAIFDTNRNFYVGVRYSGFSPFFYDSASETDISYRNSINDISLVLGARFGDFNERFDIIFSILPGFAFLKREKAATSGAAAGYGDENGWYYPISERDVISVVESSDSTFFSPAFELGAECMLTDNLVLSLSLVFKIIKVSDMSKGSDYWMSKFGDEDAFMIHIPARLSWRF